MSRNSVLGESNVNRLAVIQEDICVAEHFEDESQMNQSQVDEKTGEVVCRQHTDRDLTKEMK